VTYLICVNCGSYYELKPGEHPDDFDLSCNCGGELIVSESLDDYQIIETKTGQKGLKYKFSAVVILLFITLVLAYTWANIDNSSTIMDSNSIGTVTKEVYTHPNFSGTKIAVITGMHPREISAKYVVPKVLKSYAATHNVEIVNYQINVTKDPLNYEIGRQNGQDLVAQYVIPDIKKSDYSMVIIVHNHEAGYGDGYYIATPSMDAKSIALGESLHKLLPDFNFYTRNSYQAPEGSSITQIDNPIVKTGTPVFVYEIPEWLGQSDVTTKTDRLIGTVFQIVD
jgi:hypothetical protein